METYFTSFVAALMALLLNTANATQGQFPRGYQYFKNADGWFKMHLEATSWSRASYICSLEDAVLASPNSDFVKNAMITLMNAGRVNGHDVYQDGNPEIIHTAMHPAGANVDEDERLQDYALSNSGYLVSVSQHDSLPYICFKKAPETPLLNECGTTDNGYSLDNRTQHCYKFHRTRRTWFEASTTCAIEGSHLAVINSDVEAQVIQDIFAKNPADLIPGYVWKDSAFLGFRTYEQQKWMTVRGETLANAGYEGWAPGEPNNSSGNEYCGSVGRNGKLYDDPCSRELPYICEKRTRSVSQQPTRPIVLVLSDKVVNLVEGGQYREKH